MAGVENRPGMIEGASYTLRNVEIAVAAIATFFGHYGIAAIAAIGAVIDHAFGKHLEQRRLKAA